MLKRLKKRVMEFFRKLYWRMSIPIPHAVENYLMWRIGKYYDPKNVFMIPTDGYKDGKRGTFATYLYRYDMFIEIVRYYEDGTIQY